MCLKFRHIIKYILVSLTAIAPLACYVWQFRNNEISRNPNDWAIFGNYIGGVYSVIVALLVVYLARELSKKDEAAAKRKKAVEALHQQIVKVKTEKVDDRVVLKIYNLLEENKLYITDSLYNEVKKLADYYLEVKGGETAADYQMEGRIKDHLRSIYNA